MARARTVSLTLQKRPTRRSEHESRPWVPAPEDHLEHAHRRLLVLEQLFRVAAVDPDGRPFAVREADVFFQELAVLIAEVRHVLRHAHGAPPSD